MAGTPNSERVIEEHYLVPVMTFTSLKRAAALKFLAATFRIRSCLFQRSLKNAVSVNGRIRVKLLCQVRYSFTT